MTHLIEFEGPVPIIVEIADGDAVTVGVRPVGGSTLASVPARIGASLGDALKMIGSVGASVREALAGTDIEEAEIKIGLKASGSGQFVIAKSTLEGSFEVSFKIKASG